MLDFFVMAPRRVKNPINDIVNSAGRWVGGAAQSLDRALTADQDPTVTPLARRGIGTTQSVLDFASGGAIAAMKGGPDDVQRFASTQLALMTGLPVAGAGVGAVAKGIKASVILLEPEDIVVIGVVLSFPTIKSLSGAFSKVSSMKFTKVIRIIGVSPAIQMSSFSQDQKQPNAITKKSILLFICLLFLQA